MTVSVTVAIAKTIPIFVAVVVDAMTAIKLKPRVIAAEPLTYSQSHCHGIPRALVIAYNYSHSAIVISIATQS
jgi:hypothetical protein